MNAILTRKLLVLGLFVIQASAACAFKIDPAKVGVNDIKTRHHQWLHGIAEPVHETMAMLAWTCANQQDEAPCPAARDPGMPATLFHGVRWNDDPNNLFPSGQSRQWLFWMSDAEMRLKIKRTNPLLYRSHFGDLQILHAMAAGSAKPADTRGQILDWARFAFNVAAGHIPIDATLATTGRTHAFADFFAGTSKESWTVRRLFTNVSDFKGEELNGITDDGVRMLALGALLHTIQDSFSRSHTEREPAGEDEAITPTGPIVAFLDYRSQDSGCHGHDDVQPLWLESGPTSKGPVNLGAWVIRRVKSRAQWDGEVRSFFEKSIFPLSERMRRADAGGYDLCS